MRYPRRTWRGSTATTIRASITQSTIHTIPKEDPAPSKAVQTVESTYADAPAPTRISLLCPWPPAPSPSTALAPSTTWSLAAPLRVECGKTWRGQCRATLRPQIEAPPFGSKIRVSKYSNQKQPNREQLRRSGASRVRSPGVVPTGHQYAREAADGPAHDVYASQPRRYCKACRRYVPVC